MIFEWISKAIAAVGAFFVSDAFILALFWLLVPYMAAMVMLLACFRPWQVNWAWRPVVVAAVGVAVVAVVSPGYSVSVVPDWQVWLGQVGSAPWAFITYALLVCAGPFWLGLKVRRRVKRILQIVIRDPAGPQFEAPRSPLGPPPPTDTAGRRIVIFCDGTGNRPDQQSEGIPPPTNIHRLFDNLVKTEAQIGWYDAGVRTETSPESLAGKTLGSIARTIGWAKATELFGGFVKLRTIIEATFGIGITENIARAYAEIARQYRPGDRIYLLGFSRGAYTARAVAAVIRDCGLLRAENVRYSVDVVRLHAMRRQQNSSVPIQESFVHEWVPAVEFLGLFDTVGSLGVAMWGWWFWLPFQRSTPLGSSTSPICVHVYHALAMDERRAEFFPAPFYGVEFAGSWTTTVEQVWFRGSHCDVGGGYADAGLSDIALKWMLDACMKHGLEFDRSLLLSLRPNPLARVHDELQRQPAWRLLGSWPRWHPIAGELHPSVVVRAYALAELGRHDMTPVGSAPMTFTASASGDWDRTGLVLVGNGERYRLTWRSGEWRDKEYPSCGPSGQPGNKFPRWLLRFRRRLPGANFMTLCITIAHPRAWPTRVGGLARLAYYLFVRDPRELRQQVAPVGRDLKVQRDSIVIQNNGGDGLLYVFANDTWMTASDNSGALEMAIARVPSDEATNEPIWTLAPVVHRAKPHSWLPVDEQLFVWIRST